MKKILLLTLFSAAFYHTISAQLSSSFEVRYFSKDKAAEGITDFKGEKEFFSTPERIEFLRFYAEFASAYFNDRVLNKKVNAPEEVERFLDNLKTKPLPEIRKRLVLDQWKTLGYQEDDQTRSLAKIAEWDSIKGVKVADQKLTFTEPIVRLEKKLDSLQWRFSVSWKARSSRGKVPLTLAFKNGGKSVIEAGFHSNGTIFFTDAGNDRVGGAYLPGRWYNFRIEADLAYNRYNFYVNGEKKGDWVSLNPARVVNGLSIYAGNGIEIDDITGLSFDTTGCIANQPYQIIPFIQESFNEIPSINSWTQVNYDDRFWKTETLPAVRGGVLEEGQDLLLRKIITPDPFEKAFLNIESLDPGGEVWINGRIVFVTHNRHPVHLDISQFLIPYRSNVLAIRVYSTKNEGPYYHAPLDRNVGWFCGRAWIDISAATLLENEKIVTKSLDKFAIQQHQVSVRNFADRTFEGKIFAEYYRWHPEISNRRAASFSVPVQVFAGDSVRVTFTDTLFAPELWTHDDPNLYRVQLKLVENEKPVDDIMLITGIRTVSQEGGTFRINGNPELLGGAQTMGYRMPIENIVKWNRCPPTSVLADELLACKKLGNTLRIHVHAGGKYAHSVNDPRLAEMADQLGIMLIWPTTSWIREGEWGGIDFQGYPLYMDQVFNHPSIVMWEGSNHPNRFSGKPLSYSNRFITKIYRTIYDNDSSRLISPSSYNRHFEYRNDSGTIGKEGQPILACAEWTAPMITRGNQDALTGYGAEWQNIRNFPDPYRKSFLDSKERAYFNFEHEESIGMQNFELARGKPWYKMPSYENPYDVGSVGREFSFDEWKESQAWQAFSAWESMKWQRLKDVDGFSWCCLHGGPNSGTYRKPLIDALGHAKLSFYVNQMALQDIMAGSNNTDVVYHKKDRLAPVIINVGPQRSVKLKIAIRSADGTIVDERAYNNILLEQGRTITELESFKPGFGDEGFYSIEYVVLSN